MTNYHGLPHKGLHKDGEKRGDCHVGKRHLRLLSARKGLQNDKLKEKEKTLHFVQNDDAGLSPFSLSIVISTF